MSSTITFRITYIYIHTYIYMDMYVLQTAFKNAFHKRRTYWNHSHGWIVKLSQSCDVLRWLLFSSKWCEDNKYQLLQILAIIPVDIYTTALLNAQFWLVGCWFIFYNSTGQTLVPASFILMPLSSLTQGLLWWIGTRGKAVTFSFLTVIGTEDNKLHFLLY